jgi:FkbM family methyltransferase
MWCIDPREPNALDWLAMYRDFCWIAETPETRRSFARAIIALRALRREGRRYEVCFDHLDRHIRIGVSDESELETIRDVFVEEDYRLGDVGDVRTVVDLGSHIGASVVWFHAVYPDARIIAVEPHPATFGRLLRNVRDLDRIEAHNVAVTDAEGTVPLFGERESWSTSVYERPGMHRIGEVRSQTLDGLLGALGVESVDILKLDIEGAELPVLSSFAGLPSVGTVIGEFHPQYNACGLFEFLAALRPLEPVEVRGDSSRGVTFVVRRP